MTFPVDYGAPDVPVKRPAPEPAHTEKYLQTEVSRLLMDRYAPPGVVVTSNGGVPDTSGSTSDARPNATRASSRSPS